MALGITHLHIAMRFEPHGASITQGDEQVLVAWPAARLDACRHEFFALRPWQDEDDGDNKPLLDADLHLVFPGSGRSIQRWRILHCYATNVLTFPPIFVDGYLELHNLTLAWSQGYLLHSECDPVSNSVLRLAGGKIGDAACRCGRGIDWRESGRTRRRATIADTHLLLHGYALGSINGKIGSRRRRRMAVDHRLQTEIWLASRALCVATESNVTGFGKQRDAANHSDQQFAPEPTLWERQYIAHDEHHPLE